MKELDLAIKTLFAEFQEAVFKRFSLEIQTTSELTYVKKQIKGKKYWYLQNYIDGMAVQKYYAPSSEKTDKEIHNNRKLQRENKSLLKKLKKSQ